MNKPAGTIEAQMEAIVAANRDPIRLIGMCSWCCTTTHAISDFAGVRIGVAPQLDVDDEYADRLVTERGYEREHAERMVKILKSPPRAFWTTECRGTACANEDAYHNQVMLFPNTDGIDHLKDTWAYPGVQFPAERPKPIYLGVPEPPFERGRIAP